MSAPAYSIGSKHWPGISKFTEEAGEVLQAIGKLIATGGSARHWTAGNLHTRLAMEIGDLLAAVDFVVAYNSVIDSKLIAEQRSEKFATFARWHSEQGGIDQIPAPAGESDRSEKGSRGSSHHPPRARAGRPSTNAISQDGVARSAGSSIDDSELRELAAAVTEQLTGHDAARNLRDAHEAERFPDIDSALANDFQCVFDALTMVERNAAAAPLALLEQSATDHTVAVCALQELYDASEGYTIARMLHARAAAADVLASYTQPDPYELDAEDESSKGDA